MDHGWGVAPHEGAFQIHPQDSSESFAEFWISLVEQANVLYTFKKSSTQFLSKYVQAKLEGPSFQMQLGGRRLVVKMCDIYWPESWNLRVGYNHYY